MYFQKKRLIVKWLWRISSRDFIQPHSLVLPFDIYSARNLNKNREKGSYSNIVQENILPTTTVH